MSKISGENLVSRISLLLNAFMKGEPKLTLVQLSSLTALHPATVYRIAETLVKEGILGKDADTKMYYLGLRMIQMGEYAKSNYTLNVVSEKPVKKLAALWQERVVVDILDDDFRLLTVQYCNVVYPTVEVASYKVEVLPHCTSTGKILLAHTSEEQLHRYLSSKLVPRTERTIVSADALLDELEHIRQQGYATSIEEFEKGYQSVGAPIKDTMGQVIAATSIRWPMFRNYNDLLPDIIESVKDTANNISAELRC